MPHAMALSGFIPSFLIVLGISLLTTINHNFMQELCSVLCISPGVTLETLTGKVFGLKMKNLVLYTISASQLSAFIGCFILTVDLLHHSFCGSEIPGVGCISRYKIAGVLAIFNLLMVFIPNLKTFGYISSTSVIFQFIALFCVFFSATKIFVTTDYAFEIFKQEIVYSNWDNSLKTLGIILFIFQRITFYLPIKSNYSQIQNFHSYYLSSMNSVFFYIFLISCPCYFLFFISGKEIVFQNFDQSFRIIEITKLAYMTVIFLSNPINLFPIYNSIYSMKCFNNTLRESSNLKRYLFKLFIRIIICSIGIIFGILVTSFVKFCSFVGAFFFSFLGLILPGIMLWKIMRINPGNVDNINIQNSLSQYLILKKYSLGRKISHLTIIVIGVFIFVISTYDSITDLYQFFSE